MYEFGGRNGRATLDDEDEAPDVPPRIDPTPLEELCRLHPKLNEPVIDGLLRKGETGNIIAPPKAGKSWLGYGLALSVISGRPWFGRFETTKGRVLLLDNELHPSTLAHRIPRVGEELGLRLDEWDWAFDVVPLRGNLCGIGDLLLYMDHIEAGHYQLIILDAKYRFGTPGVSENDNNSETQFWNTLDQFAARLDAAILCVHHSSKGNQADKRVTDVGAGAGAQSRAVDAHIILREHDEEDVAVLDAAVRSFPPVEPLAIRWEWPLWLPDEYADPSRLKRQPTKSDLRQQERDKEGMDAIVDVFREHGDSTKNKIREHTGISPDRCTRLLAMLKRNGHLTATAAKVKGNDCQIYHLVGE